MKEQCGDCIHFEKTCKRLIGSLKAESDCDFFPSRFYPKRPPCQRCEQLAKVSGDPIGEVLYDL